MSDIFGPDDPNGDYPYDDYSQPLQPYDYWSDRWEGAEPPWWQDDTTLYRPRDDFPLTNTAQDWFNETFLTKEELLATYGVDNIFIIRELEAQGLWGPEDWAYWREHYGE